MIGQKEAPRHGQVGGAGNGFCEATSRALNLSQICKSGKGEV